MPLNDLCQYKVFSYMYLLPFSLIYKADVYIVYIVYNI